MPEEPTSFWQHIDIFRKYLLRCVVVFAVVFVAVFCCKEQLFEIVFSPQQNDAFIFTFFNRIAQHFGIAPISDVDIPIINTGLAQQFIIHIRVALVASFVLVFPYIVYQLMLFVGPALYENEKKVTYPALIVGCLLFYVGVALNYFFLFPLIFRFLGTYQVTNMVANYITLESYIDTLLLLSLMMGIIFELPILCYVLAKLGILEATFMRKTRKYAVVIILILSAIITPTGDAFTLFLVALPIYLLYEISIGIVALQKPNKIKSL